MTLVFILFILLWGLVIGALARLAIPGPDPMPIWMTIAIGIGGSLIGGVLTRLFFGTGVSFFFAFLGAVLLVVLYRKYVQNRPIWGPGARRPPA
ncbi:MAG TPA: GlsB/YeaQ/YmgE family stress response membrane protein [Gaiellaceae bacterium]|jgi:uncharacterized membrane protein YeaQ/YmgE (transglycosylase-associated protein family)|nr:GlsB/YeaQ/YmgE family stress response membrane protein [Gaiellaceae bacterium]